MQKLFLSIAHPDDESFVMGGTIAKYARLGWDIDVVCATRGEAGETGPYEQTIDLGSVREEELRSAASILGITSVTFLDYHDGKLSSLEPGDLEDTLYRLLKEKDPDVVITFESGGISNHPDHTRMSVATTYAFQKFVNERMQGAKIGNRDRFRDYIQEQNEKNREKGEPKLYYACVPQSVVAYLLEKEVIPKESFGKPWRGIPDKKITTVIDISDETQQKVHALAAHESQRKDAERFLSIDTQPLAYKEYYILRMHGQTEVFMGNNDEVAQEL